MELECQVISESGVMQPYTASIFNNITKFFSSKGYTVIKKEIKRKDADKLDKSEKINNILNTYFMNWFPTMVIIQSDFSSFIRYQYLVNIDFMYLSDYYNNYYNIPILMIWIS